MLSISIWPPPNCCCCCDEAPEPVDPAAILDEDGVEIRDEISAIILDESA